MTDCNYIKGYEIAFAYMDMPDIIDLSDYVIEKNRVESPKIVANSADEGLCLSATVYDKTPVPGHTVRG